MIDPFKDDPILGPIAEKMYSLFNRKQRILFHYGRIDDDLTTTMHDFFFLAYGVKTGALVQHKGKAYVVSYMYTSYEDKDRLPTEKPYLQAHLIRKDGVVSPQEKEIDDDWELVSNVPEHVFNYIDIIRRKHEDANGGKKSRRNSGGDTPEFGVQNGYGFHCRCSYWIEFDTKVFTNWKDKLRVACPHCKEEWCVSDGKVTCLTPVPPLIKVSGIVLSQHQQPEA